MNNGGCHTSCTNKVGSYDCSCDSGFVLASDGHSCNGEKQSTFINLNLNVCYFVTYLRCLGCMKLICSFSGTARPPPEPPHPEPPHPSCYWWTWKKHFCRTPFAVTLTINTARLPTFSKDEKNYGRTPLPQHANHLHYFAHMSIS